MWPRQSTTTVCRQGGAPSARQAGWRWAWAPCRRCQLRLARRRGPRPPQRHAGLLPSLAGASLRGGEPSGMSTGCTARGPPARPSPPRLPPCCLHGPRRLACGILLGPPIPSGPKEAEAGPGAALSMLSTAQHDGPRCAPKQTAPNTAARCSQRAAAPQIVLQGCPGPAPPANLRLLSALRPGSAWRPWPAPDEGLSAPPAAWTPPVARAMPQ